MRELRALAQDCLGRVRLHTSRTGGLYVTSGLPAAERLEAAGFTVNRRDALYVIGLGPGQLNWLARRLPPPPAEDFLLRQLSALSQRAVSPPDLMLLEEALKMDEPGGQCRPDFEKRLRQQAALCLRLGVGGGALALARRVAHRAKEALL